MQKFQVANSEPVHPQVIVLLKRMDAGDMLKVRMFRVFEVMQNGACSNDAFVQAFHPETFQAMRTKMFEQTLC